MPRSRVSPYPLRDSMKSNWLFQGLVRFAGAPETTTTRSIRFNTLVHGVGLLPPHTAALRTTRRYKRHSYLRVASLGLAVPSFGAIIWSNTFLVSPEEWPQTVLPLFPTDSPPTPREVVSLLLGGRPKAMRGLTADQRVVLLWWLLGTPLAAFDALLPRAGGWAPVLDAAIFALLLQPAFCLWAMGDDLKPAMSNDTRVRIIREALGHARERSPTAAGGAGHLQALWDDPYISAVLARRAPLRPIERALPASGVVFDSLAVKEATIASNLPLCDVYFERRAAIRAHFGPTSLPSWADLSPVAGELNVAAPD